MIGQDIHNFAKDLWPLNRSLTGEGNRKTLEKIKEILPELEICSVKSGTQVFDWEIPKEWQVNEAYILTPSGEKICDFSKNNLHLVGYSAPFNGEMKFSELKKHLYCLPEQPNAIPYITSYYNENWGFCISKNELDKLNDGIYKIVIDSEFIEGVLNYGELIIPGLKEKEVFLSTYICHPSMGNNELSGITVLTYLSKWIKELPNKNYTYRIVFIPETIGSIAYLSSNLDKMKKNVFVGFNVSCVGDERSYSYLPSRDGNTFSDKIAKHILKWIAPDFKNYSWLDRGSDERQYCSPGIDLPIASILRTKYGEYPEYHTSLDDLENVVTPKGLEGGFTALKKAIEIIENNLNYKIKVLCEPQMGKRGLYPNLSTKKINEDTNLMMNFLSYCDGETSLLEIAEKINYPCWDLYQLIDKLVLNNLLEAK